MTNVEPQETDDVECEKECDGKQEEFGTDQEREGVVTEVWDWRNSRIEGLGEEERTTVSFRGMTRNGANKEDRTREVGTTHR